MKIKHIWSVLAKESVINQDDNNLSIYGVLEELSVNLAPFDNSGKLPDKIGVPLNYEIVSMWKKEKGISLIKAEVEFTLIDPENKELLRNIQNIEIPNNLKRLRSRMKISGLPLSVSGDYTFQVKVREEENKKFNLVAKIPLEVKVNLEKK